VPFIGLDLGTSFLKGAVLDADSHCISHVQRTPFPTPIAGLPPYRHEIDPVMVVDAVKGLIAALLPYAAPCEGILICSQMHGLVLTTSDGQPCTNLTTWLDQREVQPSPHGRTFDGMMARLTDEDRRQLGNELRIGLPVGVLFWMAEHSKLPTNAVPLSLPDYVITALCGSEPSTELTNAHAHGLLNVESLDWHWHIIDTLGLRGLHFPAIRRHGEVAGMFRAGSESIPIYTPVGDFQCALTGALLHEDELSLNISTGSQVSCISDAAQFGNFQTRPFFDGKYVQTVTTIPAGRALNALVRLLSELAESQGVVLDDPWEYIIRAAAQIESVELSVDLSFYHSVVGTHGAIRDMREDEMTIGHLFRGAFENMANNYVTCAKRLPSRWQNLVFSGGMAAKIPQLRELIVRAFNMPFRLAPSSEDTMLGLIALGMAFTERTPTVQAAIQHLATHQNRNG
jgi:sugar (pentulose or hexulose) kinase